MGGNRICQLEWILYAVAGAVLGLALHSQFRAGGFSFHDLTLLDDLFANGIYRGRPFWVTDYAIHHWSVHFTPTLALLLPVYFFSDSQFNLVALGIVAMLACVYFSARAARAGGLARWPALALSLVFLTQIFTRTVVASAHFEVFYCAFSAAALCLLVEGRGWRWWAAPAVLALGVRQDAGFFLFFQALSAALLLPWETAWDRTRVRYDALALAALSLVACLVSVAVIMPLWGGGTDTLAWRRWGETWPEVFRTLLAHPVAVWSAIVGESGFLPLNHSTAWLPWLQPLSALVGHLPGALFYVADAPDKQELWYYNAAFLLPGLWLASGTGLAWISRLPVWKGWGPHAVGALLVLIAAVQLSSHPSALVGPGRELGFYFNEDQPYRDYQLARAAWSRACPTATSVATDMTSASFVSGRMERYLLRNWQRADVVLVGESQTTLLSGFSSLQAAKVAIAGEPLFRSAGEIGHYAIFLKKASCRPPE